MERYPIEDCVFIIKEYFTSIECLTAAARKYHTKYDQNSVLISSTVKKLIEKFLKTGSVEDAKHTGCPKTSRSKDNIATAGESASDNTGAQMQNSHRKLPQLNAYVYGKPYFSINNPVSR